MGLDLSFAIMTNNEETELKWLMDALGPFVGTSCEIVILDDYSKQNMVEYIKSLDVRFYQRPLKGNFEAQRNYLKSLCQGKFLFVLDPDELPPPSLLEELPAILRTMDSENLLACSIPRYSPQIEGDEPQDARRLNISDQDILSFGPDPQIRLLRNMPEIAWVNPVHEKLVGFDRCLRLPNGIKYALLHVKTKRRSQERNAFYDTLGKFSLVGMAKRLGLKPLAKTLGLIRQPTFIDYTGEGA